MKKLTPVISVLHLKEYMVAVADGWKLLGAPEKGMNRFNVIILMDDSEDLDKRLKFESEYFTD